MKSTSSETPIEVVVADDHDLFREGLVALLQRDRQIRVTGQASSGEDAIRLVDELQPRIVLLDVEMPGSNVRATISSIRRLAPNSIPVILTMHNDAVLRHDLLSAGASGYLTKTRTARDVVEAIHQYAAGRNDRPQALAGPKQGSPSPLSEREATVLSLMARALPNPAIAAELSIAVGTVRRHVHNIFEKLGASSRIDAVRRAESLGILSDRD